ncbi:hypothetical protein BX666DRAFT_1898086 [Dichotomocladium elegans]|nr:hypothetical protein BX666DRAFT_1898086 [Dichotomocladium elegans]
MGAPKKRKLMEALDRTLRKAEKNNKERYKQEQREKLLQKQNKKKVYAQKPIFNSNDRILLIGEGNFSFARAIAEHYLKEKPEHITATCLDTEDILYEKYGDEVKANVQALRDRGVPVLFGIDGTQLEKYKLVKKNKYTKIIFNFPHAGAGIKDQDHNVRSNQALLNSFFASAAPLLSERGQIRRHQSILDLKEEEVLDEDEKEIRALIAEEEGRWEGKEEEEPLPDGEIHITIKTCKPYDLWDVKGLAKTSGYLAVKSTLPFNPAFYPGYEHRRTLGFREGVSKDKNAEILGSDPKTFVIVRKEAMADEFERSKQGAIERKKDMQRLAALGKRKRKQLQQHHGQRKKPSDDNDDDED